MDTSIIIVAVLAVVGLAWLYLQWQAKSAEERRVFIADMVKYAAMKLGDKEGKDRFAYVFDVLRERYPRIPIDWLETAIESAVFDAKAQAPAATPKPAPVERQVDAPRWRSN
jgi:hypothetical protein